MGTFNNPNQLGYWSLLTAACLVALKGEARLTSMDLVALATAFGLAFLSGSRATILALLLLLAAALVCQGFDRRWSSVLGFLALAMAALGAFALFSFDPARLDRLLEFLVPGDSMNRLTLATEQDNATFAHRGYDRLWLYPDHLILGAGEGGFDRFTLSAVGNLELHSAPATILFSYGMPGFALFALLLFCVFRPAPLRYGLYFAPVLLFNLAHQGLRFPLFWVFLGLVIAAAREGARLSAKAPARRAQSPGGEVATAPPRAA